MSNPILACIVFVMAWATAYLLRSRVQSFPGAPRQEAIDGLRGLLAVAVYAGHAHLWYFFARTGVWKQPHSTLYIQLGETGVSLFFMITAFLFVDKINKTPTIHWKQLFMGRLFRLVPMYVVSVLFIFITVFILSAGQLKVPLFRFAQELICWMAFTIPASPAINGSIYSPIINAGVTWSLPYEWLFYGSLPLLACILTRKISSTLFLIGSVSYIILYVGWKGIDIHHLYSFMGGAIAPFVQQRLQHRFDFKHPVCSIILVVGLWGISFYPTAHHPVCKALIAGVFHFIVLGNDMMGLLTSKTMRLLGEISYSMYLIHGIVLFYGLYFGWGMEQLSVVSAAPYWQFIACLTPVVVGLSYLCFHFIEKPGIEMGRQWMKRSGTA